MLHIHLIALGKLKEPYWREAEAEYVKRLQTFVELTIHELREESFSEKDNVEVIKEKEAQKILAELEKIKNSFIIALDEHGKQFSSIQFAERFNNVAIEQSNNIAFVIGGPLGLDERIRERADILLSLSPLTFTHQMARVILLEQVYRAMMINNKRKYHY